jgi:hypothetical protein
VQIIYNSCIPVLGSCGWKPFLEREDLLVWRKEDEVFHGLYAYKGMCCWLNIISKLQEEFSDSREL